MSSNRDDFGIAFRSALLQKGAAQKFSLISLLIIAFILLRETVTLFDIFLGFFKRLDILKEGHKKLVHLPLSFLHYLAKL